MKCPRCGDPSTKITSTYCWQDGITITRHRLCRADGCWLRFKTREHPIPGEDYVVPRSKSLRRAQAVERNRRRRAEGAQSSATGGFSVATPTVAYTLFG